MFFPKISFILGFIFALVANVSLGSVAPEVNIPKESHMKAYQNFYPLSNNRILFYSTSLKDSPAYIIDLKSMNIKNIEDKNLYRILYTNNGKTLDNHIYIEGDILLSKSDNSEKEFFIYNINNSTFHKVKIPIKGIVKSTIHEGGRILSRTIDSIYVSRLIVSDRPSVNILKKYRYSSIKDHIFTNNGVNISLPILKGSYYTINNNNIVIDIKDYFYRKNKGSNTSSNVEVIDIDKYKGMYVFFSIEDSSSSRVVRFIKNINNALDTNISSSGKYIVDVDNAMNTLFKGEFESFSIEENKIICSSSSEENNIFDFGSFRPIHEDRFMYYKDLDVYIKDACGKVLNIINTNNLGDIDDVLFSPDKKKLFVVGKGQIGIFHNNEIIADLFMLKNNNWLVTDPDGRFDVSSFTKTEKLFGWWYESDKFNVMPFEIFTRDYYTPDLLPKILRGEYLKPVKNLSTINRIQPIIKDIIIKKRDNNSNVNIYITVKNKTKMEKGTLKSSGVSNLRLFRNNKLIQHYPKDEGEIKFNEYGEITIKFPNVQLPGGNDGSDVLFSSYAFNKDGVRSEKFEKKHTLAGGGKTKKGKAYVISIGVNTYQNPEWNLNYASNDAKLISATLTNILSKRTNQYSEVVPILLLSDDSLDEQLATKKNIKTVFSLLAGKPVAISQIQKIPNAKNIKRVSPDDTVIISISSHGYATRQEDFYIFPYDIGTGIGKTINQSLLNSAISDRELAQWLYGINPKEMVMILDTCQSAALVEGQSFTPAPLDTKGFGQLTYDKGMRIITASQSDNIALEHKEIKHGFLTYALFKEGLQNKKADYLPNDKRITLTEWLNYGKYRVPQLSSEIKTGKLKLYRGENKQNRKGSLEINMPQQPILFNFSDEDSDPILVEYGSK